MNAIAISAKELVGTLRSFGEDGPVYQVLRSVDERTLNVVVVETGETLDYPLAQALEDPIAN